jgi:hypothetical protein
MRLLLSADIIGKFFNDLLAAKDPNLRSQRAVRAVLPGPRSPARRAGGWWTR